MQYQPPPYSGLLLMMVSSSQSGQLRLPLPVAVLGLHAVALAHAGGDDEARLDVGQDALDLVGEQGLGPVPGAVDDLVIITQPQHSDDGIGAGLEEGQTAGAGGFAVVHSVHQVLTAGFLEIPDDFDTLGGLGAVGQGEFLG